MPCIGLLFIVVISLSMLSMLRGFGNSGVGCRGRGGGVMMRMSSATTVSVAGPAQKLLQERIRAGLISAFGEEIGGSADTLLFNAKPEFGDYQCNAALPLSKAIKGSKPKELAEKLMQALVPELVASGLVGSMDISGPGFINMRLSDEYVKRKLSAMLRDPSGRLNMVPATAEDRKRIVVDFSSPNIAKEMHVGHLRSTIIGDSLSRLLEFLGHDVVRLNHVGDWGTQFGMLIHYLNTQESADSRSISDLVEFYKAAKKKFDEDLVFQEAARNEVVKLQSGDADSVAKWKQICDLSRLEFQKIYDVLEIHPGLQERGESFYNPRLASLVEVLEKQQVAVESEGALCIFLPGYLNSDGTPLPLIVRKSDGGFLYATTDLAAVRQRSSEEKADRVLYVTDVGQQQHFQMVFDAARKAALFDPATTSLEHVPFGLVLGEDGKKFKTRSGETVKLKDLLSEACKKAEDDMATRLGAGGDGATSTTTTTSLELSEEQKAAARVVGIGAVKYADLSMNRESNYRFSFKKMLSLSGNTAPYMLYAFARIQGIRRKAVAELGGVVDIDGGGGGGAAAGGGGGGFELPTAEELALAKQLLRLEEILLEVERDLYPNRLCEYLFDLSQKFNQFYEQCPVLKAETQTLVKSRTALCSLTADSLQLGLELLGIKTLDKL